MNDLESVLPHVNASLNALATVLLVVGYWVIKRAGQPGADRVRLEQIHKWTMLAAFAASTIFLACYLYYHIVVLQGHSKKFPADAGPIKYGYYTLLLSHVVLAMAVPPLAIASIYLGLRDYRAAHRRLAKWTFPIWLYVSITGVIVYFMLYHVYRPVSGRHIIQPARVAAMQMSAVAANFDV
jgi:uncharacterized membrane protein YozB (DUF420 family)